MFPHIRYYPNIMIKCNKVSRNIPTPELFNGIVEERLQAKKRGDKATANTLKLIVNSTYGIMLDKTNPVCDPLMGRSVCITGQLFLTELAGHLVTDVKTLKLIMLNTDGIMISFEDYEYPIVKDIVNEWQERTKFELEEDKIKYIAMKDVNNYVMIFEDGHCKAKGGWLVRGIAKAGAWNINNNACIVAKAITDYLVKGISPEQTILSCDDPLQYFFIAKSSGKYERVYQLINDTEVEVQRCNRVYATKDTSYGTLYQVKKENGQISKIAGLPDHCIVDNKNEIDINQIDKKWYIALAWERIPKFIGE